VVLSQRMSKVLRTLSKTPFCVVAIVSGRSLSDVHKLVGIEGICYFGNHGLEIATGSLNYINRNARNSRRIIERVSQSLRFLKSFGATIEDKQFTLAVHFRQAPPKYVPIIRAAVTTAVRAHPQLELTTGKKVLEIRPKTKWNKGVAAKWLINKLGEGLPIYLGDDLTDEDAFHSLMRGITILVSRRRRATFAKYRLRDVDDVYKFLKLLSSWISLTGTRRITLHGT